MKKIQKQKLSIKDKNKLIKSKNTIDLKQKITGHKTLTSKESIRKRKNNLLLTKSLKYLEYLAYALFIIGIILVIIGTIVKEPEITNASYTKDNYEEIIKDLQKEALDAEKTKNVINIPKQIKEPVRVKKSYKEFMLEGDRIHKIRYEEQKIENGIISLIKKYEGIRLKAYCDRLIYKGGKYLRACYTGKERYSIGYGSTSYKGELITRQEAEKRVKKYVRENILPELENLTCWNTNEKIAIGDFMYNSGKYTKHNVTGIRFLTYVKRCDKGTVAQFIYPGNYKQKGLKKRRSAEWFYFIKK